MELTSEDEPLFYVTSYLLNATAKSTQNAKSMQPSKMRRPRLGRIAFAGF